MKKIIYIISAFTMLSITSCADKFDEIDINPNQTSSPLTYGIFNGAAKEYMTEMRGSFSSGRVALPWVQYSAQRAYTEEDRYQYRLTSGAAVWSVTYRVAEDYKQILDLNTDPATRAQMSAYGPNNNQIAASRVMLAYIFLNLADSFGDIPYYSYGNSDPDFQALQVNTQLQPKFASQAKVYADILKELKESSEMVVSGVVFTSGDRLFGSGEKLKKFANSLRLKVATRVKGVVPGAEAHIADAIASGVMTSNADTVGLAFEANLTNPSPMYNDFRTRSDLAVSKTFVDLLKGNKGNFGLDPRLFKYATPVGVAKALILAGTSPESTNPDDFNGQPYGISSQAAPSQASTSNFFSKNVYKMEYSEIFMEFAEVQFLLSEANGWSQTEYINGVRSSLSRWGVSQASADAYVAALPPASMENVMTQKYIALYMQPYEAWAEYRRTGYPKTLLLPGQTGTYNVPYEGDTTYTFTSLIPGLTDLPTRLFYPTTTQSLNRVNYEAASANIGGDLMSSKLIWDKN